MSYLELLLVIVQNSFKIATKALSSVLEVQSFLGSWRKEKFKFNHGCHIVTLNGKGGINDEKILAIG